MHARIRIWLFRTLLAAFLALAPAGAFAGVYKCVENFQTTYSNEPCGKTAQPLKPPISVTPAFVPPPPEQTAAGSGGILDQMGIRGSNVIGILLFALIPLSLVAVFVVARKSKSQR